MYNLYIAIDIGAAEPRNRRSTCENYLRVWARDCETSFSPSVTLYSPFFRSPISLFLGLPFPLLFGWRLTIPNSDARYHPFASSCFIHDQKTNDQIFVGDAVDEYYSRSACLISELKVTWIYVSIDAARADIWADLAADRDWKEHRFSAITGFKLRLCPFKYSRDEYFAIMAFGNIT